MPDIEQRRYVMRKCKILIIALVAITFVACGGEEDEELSPQCGENTAEQDGACVPVFPEECPEGEVHDDELGDCVPAGESYCGEGTYLHPDFGVCVADAQLECGEDTVEDDGDCLPALEVSCGEGTVAFDEECVARDDVCGDGTEWHEDLCRPVEDICGEGTTFDVQHRKCIPISTLECGGGTTVTDDFICVASSVYFEELAQDPDYDLSQEEPGKVIELATTGESVVIIGNIDAPDEEDGQLVQDEDYVEFEAQAGQWLEVTVYSMGLPEPGFVFASLDSDYYRLSDLGAGIEVRRQFAIQQSGTKELRISNFPQLVGELSPAGGDDWGYVAVIESMESPQATEVEILEDPFSGDIRNLSENFYHVVGANAVEAAALFFDQYAADAEAELQVWTDEQTWVESFEIDGGPVAIDTSEDSFYLLFDRVHAYGTNLDYEARLEEGQSAPAGELVVEEITGLEPGDYVGLFQDNLDGLALSARILDDEGNQVVSTNSLQVSSAETGQSSLYWYVEYATDLTLEVENTSGQDIDYMVTNTHVGTADRVTGVDGDLVEMSHGDAMSRGQRHYVEVEVEFQGLLSLAVESFGTAQLRLYTDHGSFIDEGTDLMMASVVPGSHLLVVEAESPMAGGFKLELQESQIFEVVETSSPGASIPEGGSTTDQVNVSTCPVIKEIEVHLDISHGWLGELIVDLSAPSGDVANLHYMTGGASANINDTYPNPSDTLNLGNGHDLFNLEGTNGSGGWTLYVEDTTDWWQNYGVINSWTLYLTCEG